MLAFAAMILAGVAAQPGAEAAGARADRYPESRKYLAERAKLAAEGDSESSREGWSHYVSTVYGIQAISGYAGEASSLRSLGADPLFAMDITMALNAAAGLGPDEPAGLAAGGKEILEAFERSPLSAKLDRLGEFSRFTLRLDAERSPFSETSQTMGPARATARFGTARMVYFRKTGQMDLLMASARSNFALVNASASECSTLSHLVGIGIEALVVSRALDAHVRDPLDPGTAWGIRTASRDHLRPDWSRSVHGERLAGLDMIDRIYRGASLTELSPGIDADEEAVSRSLWVKREEAIAFFDDAMDSLAGTMDEDVSRAKKSREAWNEIKSRMEDPAIERGQMLPAILLRSLDQTLGLEMEIRTLRRAFEAVLAITEYRAGHEGRLPESLKDLVPDYLAAVPVDWRAPDRPELKYKLTGKGEAGPGFVLYGVGRDGKDDGGKIDPKMIRFGGAKGTDAVFSTPNPNIER